jgi:hypothetical protein
VKVDEIVRERVIREAVKTFAWPLDRAHLNEAAKKFFLCIPSSDQRTICEVFDWEEQGSGAAGLRKRLISQTITFDIFVCINFYVDARVKPA